MRRKRIRYDRIIIVLVLFILLIFGIKSGIKFIRNSIINSSVKNKGIIKTNKDKLDIRDKTILYAKKNRKEVTIQKRKYSFTIPTKMLKNGMDININYYEDYIDEALFDNVKVLYVKKNSLLSNSSKVKIKLPRFLRKNGVVDIYGVKDGKIEIYKSGIKVNDTITIKTDKKYDDYFVAYIKLKSISVKSKVSVNKGEKVEIDYTYNPSNATNKKVKYVIKDKKIAKYVNRRVIGLKEGKTTLILTSDELSVDSIIDITVNEVKETVKEEGDDKVEEKVIKHKVEKKDGITYIDGIMIVNKTYSLPSSYNPGGLTNEFLSAFEEMQAAALLDGISLFVASGFRDYDYQKDLYEYYASYDGIEMADTYSARPGHSEHQTGLAADINAADKSFEGTPEAIWLDENCYKYGFIVRFPKGKDEFTGYEYEPWHLRYVGKEFANKIHEAGGISLEEYFDITSEYKN
ncbi:MAG: D-alanyl-D-alanine carboxypeptidase family protein [Bacilli bacterium]|nr:D-alanyl-D-alanine carboxypeptidase family protein [Bacilli bacterium]